MDPDLSKFPQIASQLRGELANLHFALKRLAPDIKRERYHTVDEKAALADQSYYRLLRLVNNLDDVRYLRDDPLVFQNRDIVGFIFEIFNKASSLASEVKLDTQFICAADQHICAFCPEALERLFYHLLSNAFKFTPPGGRVTVELKLSRRHVLLSVKDTGPGISKKQQEILFSSLQPGNPAPPSQGIGLGLVLCRAIAQKHGGLITAESRPGKGSCFTFSMPDNRTVPGDRPGDIMRTPDPQAEGGFNKALLFLADAMPPSAFGILNR